MSLSAPQALRWKDLNNDKRRVWGRVERFRRLRDEYHVMWAETELELSAIEAEIRALDRMRGVQSDG